MNQSADDPTASNQPVHIVSMGVSGSGKTTLAVAIAEKYGLPFQEGDDLHTDEAREKMGSGEALTDDDRWPWLRRIRDWMSDRTDDGVSTVVSCSALKRSYRDILREARGNIVFVHLTPSHEKNKERATTRTHEYMPATLLNSQVDTLEALADDEGGWVYVNDGTPEETQQAAFAWLEENYPAVFEPA